MKRTAEVMRKVVRWAVVAAAVAAAVWVYVRSAPSRGVVFATAQAAAVLAAILFFASYGVGMLREAWDDLNRKRGERGALSVLIEAAGVLFAFTGGMVVLVSVLVLLAIAVTTVVPVLVREWVGEKAAHLVSAAVMVIVVLLTADRVEDAMLRAMARTMDGLMAVLWELKRRRVVEKEDE